MRSSPLIAVCVFVLARWSGCGTAAVAGEHAPNVEPPIGATSFIDSMTISPDLEDALAELQEAGVLPGDEELNLLLSGPLADPVKLGHGGPRRVSGQVRVRGEPTKEKGLDPRITFRARVDGALLRGAYRSRSNDERCLRGAFDLSFRSLDVRVGDLGYAWGYGLLSAAPGRGSSLAAGQRLASVGNGPASGGSQLDPRAVTGGSLLAGIGNWKLGLLGGDPQTGVSQEPKQRPFRSLATVSRQTSSSAVGVMSSQYGRERGASLAGRWKGRWLAGGWESAYWRSDDTGGGGRAWVGHLGWAGSRLIVAEGLLCGGTGGSAPRGGRVLPFLPTADGRGWGIRAGFQPLAATTVRMMWAQGQGIDAVGAVRHRERSLVDLEVRWRMNRALWIAARWRRKVDREFVWSDRFPWEVATAEPETRRMVLSLAAGGQYDHRSYQLLLRTQSDAAEPVPRTRSLLQVSGKWRIAKQTGGRAAWATAWGGDADLVSAVSPLSGFVLPRHWGRWQSEVLAGVEHLWFGWNSQIAFSRRISVDGRDPRRTYTIWAQSSLSW